MIEVIKDTVIDTVKLIPFLWITFYFIELIEHKYQKKSQKIIQKSGKFGPILGGILGCFPQCGFSVMATNLYITKIISLGTLISIYLSTSDEMLPILLAKEVNSKMILSIIVPFSSVVCLLEVKFIVKGTYRSSFKASWCAFNLSSISFMFCALTGVIPSIHLGPLSRVPFSIPSPTVRSPHKNSPQIALALACSGKVMLVISSPSA